jgi:guanylate kinase
MKLLAFIGPSGSGKSSVARELQSAEVIALTPSWTTRPRRPDELDTEIEHRFVSDDEFVRLERSGFFLEVVEMFGLPYRYGIPDVPAPQDGRVPTLMVRAPLLPLLAAHYPDHVVYQIEANADDARQRVLARHHDASEVGSRLDDYTAERDLGRAGAHRVFSGRVALAELVQAVCDGIAEDFAVERRVQ